MENVLKYFEFSEFIKDNSGTFSSQISYSELNPQHFLIFEKDGNNYNLYISKYKNVSELGNKSPAILELLVKDYDKSNSEHRITLRRYME